MEIKIKAPALPTLEHCLISLLAYRYHRRRELGLRRNRRWRARHPERVKKFSDLTAEQKEARRASFRRYARSEKGKACQRRFNQTPGRKAYIKEYWSQRPELRKAVMARYNHSEVGKDRARRYSRLPHVRAYQKAWNLAHPEKVKAKFQKYQKTDKAKARRKRYEQKYPERLIERARKHREANRPKYRAKWNAASKRRYETRPDFRMKMLLRSAINRTVARRYTTKRTQQLLGCTWIEFQHHIENQFKPGMSWSNHGVHGWHLDHKRPIDSFDLTDPKQIEACFHYTNYQPLWSLENLQKGHKYSPELVNV